MNRRGFLRGILAAGIAPAIVSSDILMRVKPIITLDELPGFGMAHIKAEGGSIIYDSNYARILWPGIKEVWGEYYANIPFDKDLYEQTKLP